MGITYAQKHEILHTLSDPAQWQNRFDIAFFDDETRKWKQISSNKASLFTSEDHTKMLVRHIDSGTALFFKKTREGLSIRDESGRELKISSGTPLSTDEDCGVSLEPIASFNEIGLDDPEAIIVPIEAMGAFVRIEPSGVKAVFLDDIGQKITFDAPTELYNPAASPGRFFHVISFNMAAAARYDMTLPQLLTVAKLLTAKDFDLEPNIRALNELDPEKFDQYLTYLLTDEYDETFEGPAQWRPKIKKKSRDISELEIAWHDATEFVGFYVATPSQFFIQKTLDGFDLATSLDHRERIWSHGRVLRSATSAEVTPIQTINTKTSPHSLLHMLQNGRPVQDHRGREWSYVLIKSKDSAIIAEQTREVVRENLGLTGDHVSTINFADQLCLLAMDSAVLDKTKTALNASQQMLALIRSGKNDTDLMEQLFEQGADLRYIDPKAAQSGRTFANEMQDAGNNALLNALTAKTDVHDLKVVPMPRPS